MNEETPVSTITLESFYHSMNLYEVIEDRVTSAKTLKESTETLSKLLSDGLAVWTNGQLYSIKQLVEKVNGLRIEVFAREHPPPHFHISGGGIDAVFSLSDCAFLHGEIGGRERSLVEWWYKRSRPVLVKAWNESRPTDCPVGPIIE